MATANAIFASGQPKKSAPPPLRGRKPPTFPKSERRRPPLPNQNGTPTPLPKPKNKGQRPLPNQKIKRRFPLPNQNGVPPTPFKAEQQRAAATSKPKQSAAPAAFCTKKEGLCLHLSQNRATARAIFESLLKSKEMCAILYPVNIWIGRKILCLSRSRG